MFSSCFGFININEVIEKAIPVQIAHFLQHVSNHFLPQKLIEI